MRVPSWLKLALSIACECFMDSVEATLPAAMFQTRALPSSVTVNAAAILGLKAALDTPPGCFNGLPIGLPTMESQIRAAPATLFNKYRCRPRSTTEQPGGQARHNRLHGSPMAGRGRHLDIVLRQPRCSASRSACRWS